jgi:TolA-binding protein
MDQVLRDKIDLFLQGRLSGKALEDFAREIKADPEALRFLEEESAWEGVFYQRPWIGQDLPGMDVTDVIKKAAPQADMEAKGTDLFTDSEWAYIISDSIKKAKVPQKTFRFPPVLKYALAACLLATLGIGIFMFSKAPLRPAETAETPSTALGRLSFMVGDVAVRTEEEAFAPARLNQDIPPNTCIKTGQASRAVVTMPQMGDISINEKTEVELAGLFDKGSISRITVKSAYGSVLSTIKKLYKRAVKYEVSTPTSTAAIRGTSFEVFVGQDGFSSRINVLRGTVEVKKKGFKRACAFVERGQTAKVTSDPDTAVVVTAMTRELFVDVNRRSGESVVKSVLSKQEEGEGLFRDALSAAAPKAVLGKNSAPYFVEVPVEKEYRANTEIVIPIRAGDKEENPVLFTLLEAPRGMTVMPFDGVITWTPQKEGIYRFRIRISDSRGLTAERAVRLLIKGIEVPVKKAVDLRAIYRELRANVVSGHDSAAIYVERFQKDHPKSPYVEDLLYDLGRMYEGKKEWQNALVAYNRIIGLSTKSRPYQSALFRRNVIQMDVLKDNKAAESGLEEYLKDFPAGLWAEESFYRLIKIKQVFKKDKDAMDLIIKYLDNHPNAEKAAELCYHYALTLRINEDYTKALEYYKRILKQYSKSKYHEDALYWAGACFENIGEKNVENKFLRMYIEAYPKGKWINKVREKQNK